ncbi:hypothetical protein DH86_00001502 [Scytalidium sp. 3C]|nr:hypothetical protein DH86_00001502 [Scytalidium sp. 3C]
MLTFAFAMTGDIDHECLVYHTQALNNIRIRMSSPERAASESTIAAILLLAGPPSHASSGSAAHERNTAPVEHMQDTRHPFN